MFKNWSSTRCRWGKTNELQIRLNDSISFHFISIMKCKKETTVKEMAKRPIKEEIGHRMYYAIIGKQTKTKTRLILGLPNKTQAKQGS